MHEFSGVYAAAVTPRGKRGDVDFGAAFELIDHCGRAGIEGILLFGEEGEYPAFSPEERSRLAYLAAKRSRVPLLVGVGSPTLDVSLTLGREAWNAGAAALLLPPPSFFRYQAADLGEFCLQFARQMEAGTVILLYNTPLTTSEIPMDTALALLDSGLFAGINDAGGDSASFDCLAAHAGRGSFRLLAGSDTLFTPARLAGMGAVSAVACAVPELAVALGRAVTNGTSAGRDCLQRLFDEFLDWAARFPRPVLVRAAVELRGLKTGPAAVPLSPGNQRLLEEFRDWFRGWLPSVRKLAAHV